MQPLDYGRSFICGSADFNRVRFWIESRTRIIDARTETWTDCYQCGSCKSERTFAERNLLQKDNYDFLPIFGGDDLLVFRRPVRISSRYRQEYKAADVWGKPIFKPRVGKSARELNTWEQIRDATAEAVPLVSQTRIADETTGLRAIIECPTKTMNISIDKKMYQVDTGPVALPDLTKRCERAISSLRLAFVVFNAPHFADFVVEQPTPIDPADPNAGQTYHYSNPFSLPAQNRIFAVEPG